MRFLRATVAAVRVTPFVALSLVFVTGLLLGLNILRSEPRSADAALLAEVKKLAASHAGESVA